MDASRRYHRSLIGLVAVNALIKPIWILGIDRWVQNEVGLTAYGSYFSVWGLTLSAGFLLDLGLSTRIQREGATATVQSERLSGAFSVKMFLLLLYFLAIALIGWFNPGLPAVFLWGVALIQALQSFYIYLRSWVTAAQFFAADVWFSILDKALLIPCCAVWLLGEGAFLPIDLVVFIVLQAITLAISISVVGFYLVRSGIRFNDDQGFSFKALKHAWPYAVIVLLMSAHARLDGYWLLLWHPRGAWEAGRYAAGYRLLEAVNMFGYLVASFLLPYLARHASECTLTRSAIRQARWGLMVLALVGICLVTIFPDRLAAILYPADAAVVSVLWPILFGSLLGYALVHVYGTVLTARGELRVFQYVIAAALLLHLSVSYFLIPTWGAKGSALAAWISQVLAGLALMYLVHRRIGGPQPYASYLVVIFTSCVIWYFH